MSLDWLKPDSKIERKIDCVFPPVKQYKTYIGFDTETHLITNAEPIPDMVCITFSDGTIYGGTLDSKIEGVKKLLEYLNDPDVCVVGHNVFYDIAVIMRFIKDNYNTDYRALEEQIWDLFKSGKIKDTGVTAKLVAIRYDWLRYDPVMKGPAEFSLAALCYRHFNIKLEGKEGDTWRFKYKELDNIPLELWPKEAVDYAVGDAIHPPKLYIFMSNKYGVSPDETFQTESAWVLHKMGVWGIYPDAQIAHELEAKILPVIESTQEDLIELGFYRKPEFTVDRALLKKLVVECLGDKAPKTASGDISLADGVLRKCKHHLIKAYLDNKDDKETLYLIGLATKEQPSKNMEAIRDAVRDHFDDPPLTDKGQISTDRATIEQVPILLQLANIGEYEKIRTTYLPMFKTGEVQHAHWNVLVASGRVSVSKPNLNNMPRGHGVRECFKARPGYVLISADYSQAELCSLAQLCLDKFGYSRMAEAINKGQDLHLLLVSQIKQIPYDTVLTLYKAGDKEIKDLRQMAKAANFGFPGGLGPDKFVMYAWQSYKVKITREQAVDLKATWLAAYPEVGEYFKWVSKRLKNGKAFDFIQHRSGRIRGRVGFCDGCNTGFQGLTADGAKYAKNTISHAMYCEEDSPLYGSHIVAFIYDELLIEAPIGKAHEAAMELQRLMISGMQVFTPEVVTRVEVDMMYHWSKGSKAVYENGRLVPFDKDKYANG